MRGFRRLAVIGAGNMGSGIAQKMATEGFDVVLLDLDEARAQAGLRNIESVLAQGVERRIFKPADAQESLARIRATARFEDLDAVDLVVEAVFEDLAVKKQVFRRLDEVCRPDAILATNTSSFSVTEIARATARPERVLGLHYFYHPAKNRLVEVVPGENTSEEVRRSAWTLQEMLGKTPIASRDSYGFIVNRFFAPWLIEAVRMVEEGLATAATVDESAKRSFGIGMGPFELMNVTGLPIALHTATTLGKAFGAMYAPPASLAAQVESGSQWEIAGPADASRFDPVSERLAAVTFYVAAALVDEQVGSLEDVDIGARVGLRWRRGPFELLNRFGAAAALTLVTDFARRWELPVPRTLSRQAESGEAFQFQLVESSVSDGIARVTINRPDAMNALNQTVLDQLRRAFRAAAADPAVRGIIIGGRGKAFLAGADIGFFLRHIETGTLSQIRAFTEAGQDLLREIEACPKPVIARLHGLALGGGLELALACHQIVATPKATVAFPETGIGIYPGLGGTQRTTRRLGTGLAKWLVLSGETLGAEEALAIGLIDQVVPHERLDEAVAEAIDTPRVSSRSASVPPTHRAISEFFEQHDAGALLREPGNSLEDPRLAKAVRRIKSKAPIAVRLAGDLIDNGASVPLEDGLRMELSHLEEIFSTRDAYEGLSKVGRGAPVFEGR